jgi:hypothetical protein
LIRVIDYNDSQRQVDAKITLFFAALNPDPVAEKVLADPKRLRLTGRGRSIFPVAALGQNR